MDRRAKVHRCRFWAQQGTHWPGRATEAANKWPVHRKTLSRSLEPGPICYYLIDWSVMASWAVISCRVTVTSHSSFSFVRVPSAARPFLLTFTPFPAGTNRDVSRPPSPLIGRPPRGDVTTRPRRPLTGRRPVCDVVRPAHAAAVGRRRRRRRHSSVVCARRRQPLLWGEGRADRRQRVR